MCGPGRDGRSRPSSRSRPGRHVHRSPAKHTIRQRGGFMHIPRLVLLALLISVCVAPIAAQSSPDKIPASSHPQLDGLIAPPEFRAHGVPLPSLSPNARGRIHDIQSKLRVAPFDSTLAQNDNDQVCYSIRSYRVTRDDPGSDSTRLAGYSECLPAARFQVKAAVDSREPMPR
jgi:hypothetical protein